MLFSDSYYSSVRQPLSVAEAPIPLKPHQGKLASLLNRHFSSTAAGSHQPRESPPPHSMDTPQPLCAHIMECNVEDVAGYLRWCLCNCEEKTGD